MSNHRCPYHTTSRRILTLASHHAFNQAFFGLSCDHSPTATNSNTVRQRVRKWNSCNVAKRSVMTGRDWPDCRLAGLGWISFHSQFFSRRPSSWCPLGKEKHASTVPRSVTAMKPSRSNFNLVLPFCFSVMLSLSFRP